VRNAVFVQPHSADVGIHGLHDVSDGGVLDAPRAGTVKHQSRARILIASSEPIVRHGLRALLAAEADLEVVAEADDGGSALNLARQLRPDVVLIDLLIPQVDGITLTRMIRAETADVRVIVMAGVDDETPAVESIRAGASAYLPKDTRIDVFLRTVRSASAGQVLLPSHAGMQLVRVVGRHEALSERESQVLRLVARGKANKLIARELDIAQSTVKSHVGRMLGKLGLDSRTQLALYAARTGLVSFEQRGALQ
jgi:NarL family two-component system response regulator LiaR